MALQRFVCVLLLVCCLLHTSAQQPKGAIPQTQSNLNALPNTHALIIGISKYKDKGIPTLRFADKDAQAFQDYLIQLGVDSNQIHLLTNESATYINIMLELDDIATQRAKPGDRVYIYFSGHGDVESRVITNDAYLLPYDAPSKVYAISALKIQTLQSYISTLSSNGVQVIVITDACHSGNLAGGAEGLSNLTQVLKANWKDEVKLLSCQPGEISLEGKQWGDGRGLFSYELINGLSGGADKNKDGNVTLGELNLYLSDRVSEQASPVPQFPIVMGNMQLMVSSVNSKMLATQQKKQNPIELSSIQLKGLEDGILKGTSDSTRYYYSLYKIYLDSNKLYYKNNRPNAYMYYERIPDSVNTLLLKSIMKRNMAAKAFQNIEEFCKHIINNNWDSIRYHPGSTYILRKNYDTEKLKSLGLYANVVFAEQYYTTSDMSKMDVGMLQDGLNSDPNSALLYLLKGWNYGYRKLYDSSGWAFETAIRISPQFLTPYWNRGRAYVVEKKYHDAIQFEKSYINVDSMFSFVNFAKIIFYYSELYRTDTTQKSYIDSINVHLNHAEAFVNRHPEIVKSYTHYLMGMSGIRYACVLTGQHERALSLYQRMLDLGPDFYRYDDVLFELGEMYYSSSLFTKALSYYKQVRVDDLRKANKHFYQAKCYAQLKDSKNTLKCLEQAINTGFKNTEAIEKMEEFTFLHKDKTFMKLIKTHQEKNNK